MKKGELTEKKKAMRWRKKWRQHNKRNFRRVKMRVCYVRRAKCRVSTALEPTYVLIHCTSLYTPRNEIMTNRTMEPRVVVD
jgi:hypothetical protein